MPVGPIHVYDTSLRDGLRNSGIAIALDDKVRFARQLDRLNVSAIEVGFGGPTQVETMTRLAGAVEKAAVFGLSRVNRRDVDRVLGSVAAAKHPGINVFSPASPRFLEHVGQTPTAALTASLKAVAHAKPHVAQLVFTAQDAVQAERPYLVELLGAVIEAGATCISIPDTTSEALPRELGTLCRFLRDEVPGGQKVLWSVHCHDDLGLAVANCLAAIENGARQVECTVNGIGERAGNTATHLIARALDRRRDAFPDLQTDLVLAELAPTARLLAEIGQPTDDTDSDVIELLRRWRPSAAEPRQGRP